MSSHDSYCEGKQAWFDEASIPTLCWTGYPIPAVVLPMATCLLFAFSKYMQYQERQHSRRQSEKHEQYDHEYLHDNSSLATELLRITAFSTPFCLSLLITNYLTLCFGWLSMLGLEIESPTFTGGYYLGCLPLLGPWMIMSLPALLQGDQRRAKRRPWPTFVHEVIFDGEAVGWAISLQLAVWLLLRATTV